MRPVFGEYYSFSIPIESDLTINTFKKIFNLDRDTAPGLSIIIPYPDENITFDTIMKSFINHYFYPVLSGKLSVIVETDGIKEEINQQTIEIHIENIKLKNATVRLPELGLAKWAITQTKPDVELDCPEGVPRWGSMLIPEDSDIPEKIKLKIESQDKIWIRIQTKIKKRCKDWKTTYFDVYIEPDGCGKSFKPVFIRDGITISEVVARTEGGIRSLVVINDKILATFLGDSENPAHTKWLETTREFRNMYENASACLRFIKNSVTGIMDIIRKQEGEIDTHSLLDTFYLPQPDTMDTRKRKKKKPDKNDEEEHKKIEIEGSERSFDIVQIAGGFKVIPNSKLKGDFKTSILNVSVAYRVRKGKKKSFKQYEKYDFQMDKAPIKILAENSEVLEFNDNTFSSRIYKDFSIQVTGFDVYRDLVIDADGEEENA